MLSFVCFACVDACVCAYVGRLDECSQMRPTHVPWWPPAGYHQEPGGAFRGAQPAEIQLQRG